MVEKFKSIKGNNNQEQITKLLSVLANKGVITEADAKKVNKSFKKNE